LARGLKRSRTAPGTANRRKVAEYPGDPRCPPSPSLLDKDARCGGFMRQVEKIAALHWHRPIRTGWISWEEACPRMGKCSGVASC
jgi:hypothetical protein